MGFGPTPQPRRLIDKFLFIITSPLLSGDAGFTTMSDLKITVEPVKYRAGGSLIPTKSAGLVDFDPVTLERGATTDNNEMMDWMQRVIDAPRVQPRRLGGALGAGTHYETGYKSYMDFVHQDRGQAPIKRWKLFGAFPTELTPAQGADNNQSERAMETGVFEYDFFQLVDANDGNFLSRVAGAAVNAAKSAAAGIVSNVQDRLRETAFGRF